MTIPGLKGNTGEIFYRGRTIQVPINYEQSHEFSWVVLNDASGTIYTTLREIMINDYNQKMLDNGFTVTVKARDDKKNNAGMNVIMKGVRINSVGSLDYSHSDSSV